MIGLIPDDTGVVIGATMPVVIPDAVCSCSTQCYVSQKSFSNSYIHNSDVKYAWPISRRISTHDAAFPRNNTNANICGRSFLSERKQQRLTRHYLSESKLWCYFPEKLVLSLILLNCRRETPFEKVTLVKAIKRRNRPLLTCLDWLSLDLMINWAVLGSANT